MATVCDACGHKDNEVKGGSGIEPKGTKITLKITDTSDMSRDVLKVFVVCKNHGPVNNCFIHSNYIILVSWVTHVYFYTLFTEKA